MRIHTIKGFTLLELLISMMVLLIFFGIMYSLYHTFFTLYKERNHLLSQSFEESLFHRQLLNDSQHAVSASFDPWNGLCLKKEMKAPQICYRIEKKELIRSISYKRSRYPFPGVLDYDIQSRSLIFFDTLHHIRHIYPLQPSSRVQ